MMKEFILDKNVDIKPHQERYPKYLFDDLRKNSKVVLVVGGNSYKEEIKDKPSLLALISELISSGKVRKVSDEPVNEAEKQLISRITNKVGHCPTECDDHHIFALALVSGCLNIITKDNRMALCRNKIRNSVGHTYCPDIRVIMNEAAYADTPE